MLLPFDDENVPINVPINAPKRLAEIRINPHKSEKYAKTIS